MFADCLRIQKTIQVRMTTATSMAAPSNTCSARPSNSPTVKKMAPPATRLTSSAAPVPSQTNPNRRRFPVLARYARMMPTMRAASSPSRESDQQRGKHDERSSFLLSPIGCGITIYKSQLLVNTKSSLA